MLKRYNFHPLFFAAYPILALLANNLSQVRVEVALRPLAFSLAGSAALYIVLWCVLRHQVRAALITSLVVLVFFSYGHVLPIFTGEAEPAANPTAALLLGLLFLALLALWTWLVLKKIRNFTNINTFFNLIGFVLVAVTVLRILWWSAAPVIPVTSSTESIHSAPLSLEATLQPPAGDLPDVYFIVLDTYTRQDALQTNFGYDNTPFLNELRDLGFVVEECSTSNYDYTMQSMSSALNMDYLTELQEQLNVPRLNEQIFGTIIHHSRVRAHLEALGYQTIAFETGYGWSELTDASVYNRPGMGDFLLQGIDPFEAMLVKSTALLPLVESRAIPANSFIQGVNFPFSEHIRRELSLLEQLPQIPKMPEATFAFIHILIPHPPFVFASDGTIHSDTGYYGGPKHEPIDTDYQTRGYVGQVEYINSRILPILRGILDTPGTPPIIVMQGDHGFTRSNRYKILNTYFVNQKTREMLYPSISPINSFRVIFNGTFGTDFPLLPDESYTSKDITRRATRPACQAP